MLLILGIIIGIIICWLTIQIRHGIKLAKMESQIPKPVIVNGIDITKVPDKQYNDFINLINRKREDHKRIDKILLKDEMKRLNEENEKQYPS